jgi:hypothetical protein
MAVLPQSTQTIAYVDDYIFDGNPAYRAYQ